jgi:Fe2+ transport system protein FeoA
MIKASHARGAAAGPAGEGGTGRRLVACRAGERVVVGAVVGGPARIDRLASLGILPGVELRVLQTRPVVVVESDETVLALDREIAADIVALRLEDTASTANAVG